MLAVPSEVPGVPPAGPGWQHEVKWDGIRLLAETQSGELRLTNRNEIDVTVAYPELAGAAAGLPEDVLLDGEVVAFGDGKPSFARIASRMHIRDERRAARAARVTPVTFMVFDVLRLGGVDMLRLPLTQRRDTLEALELPGLGASWQVPPTYNDGDMLAAATRAQALEGVLSKRLESTYQPGVRSPDWVKAPHRTELVGVIGGWVPETDSANRLGSVWIGHPHDEATFEQTGILYPVARVGSGLPHDQRDALLDALRQIERPTCPFVPPPVGSEVRRTTWVEPLVCVQVRHLGRSDSGVLRQPVLRAIRPELTPLQAPTADLLQLES